MRPSHFSSQRYKTQAGHEIETRLHRSLPAALSQQPIGGHLPFALDVDVSSQLQLETVELLQDVAGRC